MPLVGEQHDPSGKQLRDRIAVAEPVPAQHEQPQLIAVVQQQLLGLTVRKLPPFDGEGGILRLKLLEQRIRERVQHAIAAHEGQIRATAANSLNVLRQLPVLPQEHVRLPVEVFPRGGGLHAPGGSCEQHDVQLALQVLQQTAQSLGRDVELLRSLAQAPLLIQLGEGLQHLCIHACTPVPEYF